MLIIQLGALKRQIYKIFDIRAKNRRPRRHKMIPEGLKIDQLTIRSTTNELLWNIFAKEDMTTERYPVPFYKQTYPTLAYLTNQAQ